jgi:hypothetical protein
MRGRLLDHIRSLVIKQWLEGVQRDMIAAIKGLSAGAEQMLSITSEEV